MSASRPKRPLPSGRVLFRERILIVGGVAMLEGLCIFGFVLWFSRVVTKGVEGYL